MKRIFDETITSSYNKQKRLFLLISMLLSIVVLSINLLLIIYRSHIGLTLSKILNIFLSALYLIFIYFYLAIKILPKRKTSKLLSYLLKHEQRQIAITYLGHQQEKVTKYNHQFIILNIQINNEKHQSIIYLFNPAILSDLKEDTNYTFYLSENILMGYQINEK